MDIFKLFFNHDQRLDKLAPRNANKATSEPEGTLADFMSPQPTYSKFYITGTLLEEEHFGLDQLEKAGHVIQQLDSVFAGHQIHSQNGTYKRLPQALEAVEIGEVMTISQGHINIDFNQLRISEESNIGHKKEELSIILKKGAYILYKEQSHHGFDLHLLSRKNIYSRLFNAFQPLVDDKFRFFSINSNRIRSERHFYFETWRLGRPPHGAEEVLPETIL